MRVNLNLSSIHTLLNPHQYSRLRTEIKQRVTYDLCSIGPTPELIRGVREDLGSIKSWVTPKCLFNVMSRYYKQS